MDCLTDSMMQFLNDLYIPHEENQLLSGLTHEERGRVLKQMNAEWQVKDDKERDEQDKRDRRALVRIPSSLNIF
jgi:hypothetical protein